MKTFAKLAKTRGTIPALNNVKATFENLIVSDLDTFIICRNRLSLPNGFYHAENFDKKPIKNESPELREDHFPEVPKLEKADIIDVAHLTAAQLKSLSWVARAMSVEQVRYYLMGVCFDGRNGAAVATDGHRLHKMDFPLRVEHPDYPMGMIIGAGDIKLIVAMVSEVKPASAEIIFYKNRWVANIGEFQIIGKYIDGTFPDWVRVTPSIDPATTNSAAGQPFKAKDLKEVLSEAKTRAKIDGTKIQLFKFLQDKRFRVFYPNTMAKPLYIENNYAPPVEIGFSVPYFADAPEKGTIYFPQYEGGAVRIDGESDGHVFVLMPNRNAR